eukprot:7384944-Prymnesium_polylepis.1
MPAVADVEPPPNPLLIFHTLLFDAALEAWTVDPDLHPLQALRAHIPAYGDGVHARRAVALQAHGFRRVAGHAQAVEGRGHPAGC